MKKLSTTNKVIFIEYQPSFLHCYFKNLSHINYDIKQRGVLKKICKDLYIYSPKVGLPFNNYLRAINVLNQKKTAEDIKLEIAKYDAKDIILWVFVPYSVDFINALEDKFLTVYHCLGNYSTEKANFLRRRTILRMENDLLRHSDIIVAQTRFLCERFSASSKKTFYMPSAIKFSRFSESLRARL